MHDGVAGLVPRSLQRLDEVVRVDTQGTIGANPGKLLPAGRGKDRPPFTLLELLDQPLGRGSLHQARRQLDSGRAFLGGGHPLGVAAVDHDQQSIGFDFAQGIREHLGRECRVSNVEGFNIVGDQVVLARGLVKPAVTGVEDHGGGIRVGAGLRLEPCETVDNCGFGCGLVVDLPDVAIVAGIGAEIGVDQDGPDRLDILDSDRKRPGRVGGLTDADQQSVALRECVGHGNYPLEF